MKNIRTLDQFIVDRNKDDSILAIPKSEYVAFPGFRSLYVRYGPRYINGVKTHFVLTISNIEAEQKGNHVVDKLIEHIINSFEFVPIIYFENVLNENLCIRLEAREFEKYLEDYPPSYILHTSKVREEFNRKSKNRNF